MSGQDGMMVMVNRLFGESADPSKYFGKKIVSAEIIDETIRLVFDDKTGLRLWDNGQSCCEHRFMTTDDDLSTLVGAKLQRLDLKNAPDLDDNGWSVHEIQFLEIGTDKGFVTIVNHNDHNGYYGGFSLTLKEEVFYDHEEEVDE
jgi:hypothetical protein